MRVTDEMVNAARSAYSVDRIPNGEIINKIAGPGYGDKLIRGIIDSALSHAAGQDGEQCRAASGLADHEACALVDRLIDAVWDEANSAHKGTTGECVNAAKETERVKHGLLRALSRGVPEGE